MIRSQASIGNFAATLPPRILCLFPVKYLHFYKNELSTVPPNTIVPWAKLGYMKNVNNRASARLAVIGLQSPRRSTMGPLKNRNFLQETLEER